MRMSFLEEVGLSVGAEGCRGIPAVSDRGSFRVSASGKRNQEEQTPLDINKQI